MTWPRGALADVLGDNVVYRNLEPIDPRLHGLRDIWRRLGMDHYSVPRKTSQAYAVALADLIAQAQERRCPGRPVRRILFVGDTAMNDGLAARNLGRYWPMLGFIGADRLQQPPEVSFDGALMIANRWQALGEFYEWVRQQGVVIDEGIALLLDLDKTSLGARGRNDRVIDEARVQAICSSMRQALGGQLDEAAFRAVYDPLNQPLHHPFTADNQDYVAYITLMTVAGICPAGELWHGLQSGALRTFEEFVARCEARRADMSSALLTIHDDVRAALAAGDPTPFKTFRRQEYRETVGRMDVLGDEATADEVLSREIVITAEVASMAGWMARQGALVFGLSDKPDEASLPTPDAAAHGYRPLHRTTMKVVGDRLF